MDVVGMGTDIIECPRIGRMIEHHGELFLRRVYTEREIRFCQSRKHAIEHFDAHWAAKEAIFKALGTNWSRGVAWTEIEIRQPHLGRPRVHVAGEAKTLALRLGIGDIHVALSHCRTYATATALALAAPGRSVTAPLESNPAPEAPPTAP